MPPTGGIIPGQSFATVKLLKYVSAYDYAVLGNNYFIEPNQVDIHEDI